VAPCPGRGTDARGGRLAGGVARATPAGSRLPHLISLSESPVATPGVNDADRPPPQSVPESM